MGMHDNERLTRSRANGRAALAADLGVLRIATEDFDRVHELALQQHLKDALQLTRQRSGFNRSRCCRTRSAVVGRTRPSRGESGPAAAEVQNGGRCR